MQNHLGGKTSHRGQENPRWTIFYLVLFACLIPTCLRWLCDRVIQWDLMCFISSQYFLISPSILSSMTLCVFLWFQERFLFLGWKEGDFKTHLVWSLPSWGIRYWQELCWVSWAGGDGSPWEEQQSGEPLSVKGMEVWGGHMPEGWLSALSSALKAACRALSLATCRHPKFSL